MIVHIGGNIRFCFCILCCWLVINTIRCNKMDILKELVSLGKELGYEGENLQKYVDRELDRFEAKAKQDRDRIERAEQRELA